MTSTAKAGCVADLLGPVARSRGARCECEKCAGNLPARREFAPEASQARPPLTRPAERPRYGSLDGKMSAAGDVD
jgi:hypothetical protein